MVNVFDIISLKNMQIVILLLSITLRLNQELDITGLPPSFYINSPELFIRNNKNMVNVFDTISLKNMQIVILLLNYITTQSGTRHNRFASFILYKFSRTVY